MAPIYFNHTQCKGSHLKTNTTPGAEISGRSSTKSAVSCTDSLACGAFTPGRYIKPGSFFLQISHKLALPRATATHPYPIIADNVSIVGVPCKPFVTTTSESIVKARHPYPVAATEPAQITRVPRPSAEKALTIQSLKQSAQTPVETYSVELVCQTLEHACRLRASAFYIEPEKELLRTRIRTSRGLREEIQPTYPGFNCEALYRLSGTADMSPNLSLKAFKLTIRLDEDLFQLQCFPLTTAQGFNQISVKIQPQLQSPPILDCLQIPPLLLHQLRDTLQASRGLVLINGEDDYNVRRLYFSALQDLNTPARKIVSLEEISPLALPRITHVTLPRATQSVRNVFNYTQKLAPDVLGVEHSTDDLHLTALLHAAGNDQLQIVTTRERSTLDCVRKLSRSEVAPGALGSKLRAILSVHVLPEVCAQCKVVHHPSDQQHAWMKQYFPGFDPSQGHFAQGEGCDACAQSGYGKSRAIYEWTQVTPDMAAALSSNDFESFMTSMTLHEDFEPVSVKAFTLARKGLIPLESLQHLC